MNKTKIILSVIGGLTLVAVLAMAYLTWTSFAAKTAALEGDDEEGVDGLETVQERAATLSKKSVYPCAKSVTELASNRADVVAWKDEAFKLAARGDRPVVGTTPAAFKEMIVGEAKRVAALEGEAGAIAAPNFEYGPFKPYVAEGKMPAEADLATLQRQWDDVAAIAELLATNGILRLTALDIKAAKAEEKKPAAETKKAKKSANRKAASDEPATIEPSVFGYVFTFQTRPAALVRVVNALAKEVSRFYVVDDFTFTRSSDVIANALGGGEKKEAAQSTSSRRRRRGRAAAAEPETQNVEEAAAKNGIVTDPLLDPPLVVTMTISVYDFGSLDDAESKEVEK